MARPLRIELAGGIYHVTSRGNGRNDIYLDDEDRTNWLVLFDDVCSRFNWVCHAYCLMTDLKGKRQDLLVVASGGYTLAEIGGYFSLHYSTVSRIIHGGMQKLRPDPVRIG